MGTRKNFVLGLALFAAAIAAFPVRAASAPTLFEAGRARLLDAFSGADFLYFDKADRQAVFADLIKGIEANYALPHIKSTTIGLDFKALAQAALELEASIADVQGSDAQAEANLAFLDRVRLFVAAFQDTHFSIRARNLMVPVSLGIDFTKVGDKFLVSGRNAKLLAHSAMRAEDSDFTDIKVGDELVMIDGQTPSAAAAALAPYVFASSPAYRELRSVTSLSLRSFRLPAKGYSLVSLKDAKGKVRTLQMPWFYKGVTRADEARYLASRGFVKTDELALIWDAATQTWTRTSVASSTYVMAQSTKALLDAKLYLSSDAEEGGAPVMRTGYVVKSGKAYGVIQLFSFYAKTMSADGGKTKVTYMEPLRTFVKELSAQNVPLILDLRTNGGGYGSYPSQVLSILARADETYANNTWALPITRYVRQMSEEDGARPQTFPGLMPGASADLLLNMITNAVAAHEPHTAAYSVGDVTADPLVGGYAGKIVALIAPSCVSACDIMSMLLRASGRATLVGQPANGTGAGFRTTDSFDTEWSDSYRVLNATFPNALFGRPAQVGVHVYPGQAVELNSENKPVQPDVPYSTTLEDIQSGDAGWIKQAIDLLN